MKFLCLVLLALGTAGPSAVELRVRPQIMLQRGHIRAEIRVPPHPENRRLDLQWDSDIGSRGRTMPQLDGADAPTLHVLELPGQPAANYVFTATVIGRDGRPRAVIDARIHHPEGELR
jgi:hypothetical protein